MGAGQSGSPSAHSLLCPSQWGLLWDGGWGGTESMVGGGGSSTDMSLGKDHDLFRVDTVQVHGEPR